MVTVVFNDATTIEDTILSVARQTFSDREHVIVDGASSDGTLEIIAKHRQKITSVLSEPDDGLTTR